MRTKLALLAAVILGFLAAIGVRHYVEQQEIRYKGQARRAAIAVAREDIPRGGVLRENMIKPVEVEEIAVGAMHVLYDQRRPWVGQMLAKKVRAGDPLMKSDFLAAADIQGAAPKIEPGWRAITVGTDQIAGVAGLITPGCRVDILGTFREQGSGPQAVPIIVTRLVARNVEVLAVDNRTELSMAARGLGRTPQGDRGYSSVTLHVTAIEASLLTFAQQASKLSFTLRRTDDASMKELIPEITEKQINEIIAAAARQREQLIQQPKAAPTQP